MTISEERSSLKKRSREEFSLAEKESPQERCYLIGKLCTIRVYVKGRSRGERREDIEYGRGGTFEVSRYNVHA